jgi:hypothetical protein
MLGGGMVGIPPLLEVIQGNSIQQTISSLFSAAAWASTNDKILTIPAGVTIGSNDPGTPALRTGTGRGGRLIIRNFGNIYGAGGLPNSGQGGDAFVADQSGVTLYNAGLMYSGGGAGGVGGNGGAGNYPNVITETHAYYISSPVWYWGTRRSDGIVVAYWNGNTPFLNYVNIGGASSWYDGSTYTYYKDTYSTTDGTYNYYNIYRTHVSGTIATSGGNGGNGGRGYGYDGVNASGLSGAVGGTNAGTGGLGGTGGGWGVSGSTGGSGTAGNNGAGLSGAGGGSPGYYVRNNSNVTLINTGSIAGLIG